MRFIDFRYPPFIWCLLCPHSSNTKHRITQDCGNCNFPCFRFLSDFFSPISISWNLWIDYHYVKSCAMPNFGEGFGINDASFLSINKKLPPFSKYRIKQLFKQLFICWFVRKITRNVDNKKKKEKKS